MSIDRLHTTTRRRIGLAGLALSVLLVGCATPSAPQAGGPTSTAGTPPPVSAPDGTNPVGTSAGTIAAGYLSAITDDALANPAFRDLGRDITRRITAAGLPGASLLVLRDGQLVEQEAFGGYDLTTVVPIASASKWFTGVTIMTLVEDGLIDLDAPISTYLPEADEPSGQITMRQLLAFTSGLEYDERIPCYSDRSVTLAECNAQILDLPLLGAPGTGYRYTGTHLHVAAGVAQAVTGLPWEQLFQERVARPLGMASTTFVSPIRAAGGQAADGHPIPAGSAVSTLGDYGRFLEMLVHDGLAPDGTRVLSAESVAEMGHDQTGGATFVSAASNRKAAETPYGLAHWLDVTDANGDALVESSPGKFGFRPWIDHVNDVAGVYLVVDQDDENVADSPDRRAGATSAVQTSGNFVLAGTAKAVGGQVPDRG